MDSSVHIFLHGAKMLMPIDLSPNNASSDRYRIELFDTENKEFVFSDNLQGTIEIILLGKLHKAQLQAMDKKESVAISAEREVQNNG